MPFYVAHDPQEHTPSYVEVWTTAFPTREAAMRALQERAQQHAMFLVDAYIVLEAATYRAAVDQIRQLVRGWSR